MKHLNDQYFDGNRLREVGTPVADADAANKAYVDGKIPKLRTINGEQLEDSSLGDINIHDGFYFPNAVQDYDGNWYGAVVIGKQVWLAENLRTTHYADGTPILAGDPNAGSGDPYYHNNDPNYYDNTSSNIPLAKRGYLYNWPAVMNGAASSKTNPSGVQGIAPNGWHVPSDAEWKQLINYVDSQTRYKDKITKALASTQYWVTTEFPNSPSKNPEDNNDTGFSAIPAGCFYSLISYNNANYRVDFWSSSLYGDYQNNYFGVYFIYSSNIVYYSSGSKENGYSVRCVSNLNPIQFRDWYIRQYGSLQHHLGNGGEPNVQSDWNQTDNTAADYIKNKPTIPTVPTNVSAFTNDAGYLTASTLPKQIVFCRYNESNQTIHTGTMSVSSADIELALENGFIVICEWEGTFLQPLYALSKGCCFYGQAQIGDTITERSVYYSPTDQLWHSSSIVRSGIREIAVSSPTDGQILVFDANNNRWINAAPPTGTLPSQTGHGGKFLKTDGANANWSDIEYDLSHQTNTTVSTSTHTVTFAANQRGSAMLTVSADLGLTIECNNGSDNYIWIKNTGSAEVDITISSVTWNNTSVANVYVPSDGISIPAGGLCEIGIVCNADGAFITARNDLSL